MALRKTRQGTETPSKYKGNQRVFAAILYEALKQAGYDIHFLQGGKTRQGLFISLSESVLTVGKLTDLGAFTLKDAEQCAKKLNAEFGKVTFTARSLATARRGRTIADSMPYAEVVLRQPNFVTLQLLRRSFLK